MSHPLVMPFRYRAKAPAPAAGLTLSLTDLIAWWSFNDTLNDAHTNGLNLTNNNAAPFTADGAGPGGVGKAIDFTAASSQYADHADDDLFDITGDYTWHLYLDPDDLTSSDKGIFDHNGGLSARQETALGGYPRFGHGGNYYGETTDNSNDLATGGWQHFWARFDATANTIEYSRNNGTPTTISGVTNDPVASGSTFDIGRFFGSNYFDGRMAEFGLWARKLTDQELTDISGGDRRTLSDFN